MSCRKIIHTASRSMTARRRTRGRCITSSASKTWSTTTSPTCSTPTAIFSLGNMASRWLRTFTISAPRATGGDARPSTPASCRAIEKLGHACRTGRAELPAGIPANPWQTDTCIGDWHYNREARYKSPKYVVDLLVDIVSRNGNLMLNFPLPNSGELDYEEMVI